MDKENAKQQSSSKDQLQPAPNRGIEPETRKNNPESMNPPPEKAGE